MKTKILSMVFILLPIILHAQSAKYPDDVDPFLDSYILGNNAEIYVLTGLGDSRLTFGKLDPLEPGPDHEALSVTLNDSASYIHSVISGDFNADMKDDCAFAYESNGKAVLVLIEGGTGNSYTHELGDSVHSIMKTQFQTYGNTDASIRLAAGNFDPEAGQEIAFMCWRPDEGFTIKLFKTGSTLNIVTTLTSYDVNPQTEFDLSVLLGDQCDFDIAAGDFDGDGLDELVFVKPGRRWETADNCTITYEHYWRRFYAKIFDYDHKINEFKSGVDQEFYIALKLNKDYMKGQISDKMTVASGNLNKSFKDEFIIGFEWSQPGNGLVRVEDFFIPIVVDVYNDTMSVGKNNDMPLPLTKPDGTRYFWYDVWRFEYLRWTIAGYIQNEPDPGHSFSMQCADLDRDGIDELITAGGACLAIFKSDTTSMSLLRRGGAYLITPADFQGRSTLAVADMNADTSKSFTEWTPEIVYMDLYGDNLRFSIYTQSNTDYSWQKSYANFPDPGLSHHASSIVMGDFDGDALRLGKPTYTECHSVIQPLVILNAPPMHFDILSGNMYDVCNAFFDRSNCGFSSSYSVKSSTSTEVTNTLQRDWAVSAKLDFGGKIMKETVGISQSIEARYGGHFEKTGTKGKTITVSQAISTFTEDRMYCNIIDYQIWEYPVYCKGILLCHIMATTPHLLKDTWISDKDTYGRKCQVVLNHEQGNILSYPEYDDPLQDDPCVNVGMSTGSDFSIGQSTNIWTLNQNTFDASDTSMSHTFGFTTNTEVKGVVLAFNLKGSYDQNQIETSKTTISNEFQMEVSLGSLKTDMVNTAQYFIRTYAYWSQCGALVLDYSVTPQEAQPGDSPTWWQANYATNPDPAFCLPWRYDPEKGQGGEELRHRTKEIFLDPDYPEPGDTVKITAVLHNYSLTDMADNATVSFYLGDPASGGELITLKNGYTQVYAGPIQKRGKATVEASWNVPASINQQSRLYAVIDPNNLITEVHETNNKAWIPLGASTTDLEHPRYTILPTRYRLHQNFPNPFNPVTNIQYEIPVSGYVEISVYNILGQKLITLINEYQLPGHYAVQWAGQTDMNSKAGSGLYFCRIKAGDYTQTRKMLIMK